MSNFRELEKEVNEYFYDWNPGILIQAKDKNSGLFPSGRSLYFFIEIYIYNVNLIVFNK
jgi:hypothetical protein